MKNAVKVLSILLGLMALQYNLFGNDIWPIKKEKNVSVMAISTSAHCQDCKERIEYTLTFTKGILKADFDAMTNKLLVKYKRKKITADDIRVIVSGLGYDADHIKADKGAYKVLPKSCKSQILTSTN